jgi:hypothetical protein
MLHDGAVEAAEMSVWWNYETEQYEERDMPTTDREAKPYLWPIAQRLYDLYRAHGDSIPEAMEKVLRLQIEMSAAHDRP